MKYDEFQIQIERLKSTYGINAYPDERIKLLWKEVGYQTQQWLESTVSYAIGSLERPPMVTFFIEQRRLEIERRHAFNKETHKKFLESKDEWDPDTVMKFDLLIKKLKLNNQNIESDCNDSYESE